MTDKRLARTLVIAAIGAAGVGGLVTGSLAVAAAESGLQQGGQAQESSANVAAPAPNPTIPSHPPFEVNAKGQTYGSAEYLNWTPDSLPDLVLVVTDDGGTGYVAARELFPEVFGEGPANPEAALVAQANSKPRILVAYKSDGTTVVGAFTTSVPEGYGATGSGGTK